MHEVDLMLVNSKICLGTVKIGIPLYGHSVDNNPDEHESLLLAATELGIDSFDTSPRYKNSENVIGNFINEHNENLFISTKIDNLIVNNNSVINQMRESVLRSMDRLGLTRSIDLCYLHQNKLSVISDRYVLEGIDQLKSEGLIDNIGASIYSFEELDYVVNSNNYDWIQAPVNILDTSFYSRIIKSGSTIKIAARSVFMQGIIFDVNAIKSYIPDADKMILLLNQIKTIGRKHNIELDELAIAYLFSLQYIDQILVGTTSIRHLERIMNTSKILLDDNIVNIIDNISEINKPWTNPRMWNG
jgi:aryl-alcohol dehydrogenase-like predicted oxidoreductase